MCWRTSLQTNEHCKHFSQANNRQQQKVENNASIYKRKRHSLHWSLNSGEHWALSKIPLLRSFPWFDKYSSFVENHLLWSVVISIAVRSTFFLFFSSLCSHRVRFSPFDLLFVLDFEHAHSNGFVFNTYIFFFLFPFCSRVYEALFKSIFFLLKSQNDIHLKRFWLFVTNNIRVVHCLYSIYILCNGPFLIVAITKLQINGALSQQMRSASKGF